MAWILIIEDEGPLGTLYRLELEDEGHDVTLARDADEAVLQMARHVPDLLIVDIGLAHGPDGLQVMSRLLEQAPELPVIINTAYSHHRESAASWKADAYLVKSSDLTELKRTVAEVLEKHGKA
jgi:DNA-binding response OmpR family regulator